MKRLIGMQMLFLFAGCGPDLTLPGALGPMWQRQDLTVFPGNRFISFNNLSASIHLWIGAQDKMLLYEKLTIKL